MAPERVERRLAAILAADVVGYSRLVGADEEGTLARLRALRDELIDPSIALHGGRIVKTTGDGLLVEFPSVVDAARNAVEVQRAMAERNAELSEERRLEFRVGINQGDIVVEDDDILGDGVNVAARLEGLAQPGGICISERVYTDIRGKLDVGFEGLGAQDLKNIAEPVVAYRLLLDPEAAGTVAGERKRPAIPWRWGAIAAAMAILSAAGGGVWWLQPWALDVEPARADKMALPLPDKPSIAVLPFDNLSGDPDQDYFADGITEDIITDLSKISGLFVIARNSTYEYKDKPAEVREVARDLGVRHVLEGSVRKAGDRLRITAQLVDGKTGNNVWAERYDRELRDVFAVQDEVSWKVVSALAISLTAGEEERLGRIPTTNIAAYELFLQGKPLLGVKPGDKERMLNARRIFERVIELDPAFAGGYAGLSRTYSFAVQFGHSTSRSADAAKAFDLARKALELDESFELSHMAVANAHSALNEQQQAIATLTRMIELFPNSDHARAVLGMTYVFAGEPERGVRLIRQAIRLNPTYVRGPYLNMLGIAYFILGRYGEAVETWEENVARGGPVRSVPAFWAAAYHQLGRGDEAKAARARLLENVPDYSTETFALLRPFSPAVRERISELFDDAGLPE